MMRCLPMLLIVIVALILSQVWDLPLATVIHLEPNSEGAKNINMGFLSGTDPVWSGNRFANKQGAHKYIRWNCRTTNCRTANNLR